MKEYIVYSFISVVMDDLCTHFVAEHANFLVPQHVYFEAGAC